MKKISLSDFVLLFLVLGLIVSSFIEIDTNPQLQVESKSAEKMHEKDYVNKYCEGTIEYVLPDKTRVDCLTDEYAIEFDYAKKWAESVGQSLYYAKKTGKKPAVAIIISKNSDRKYLQRINDIDKDIKIFEIPAVDYKE